MGHVDILNSTIESYKSLLVNGVYHKAANFEMVNDYILLPDKPLGMRLGDEDCVFICSCSLWLCYGVIKPDFTISLVNTVGIILQLSYIVIYHTYSDSKVTTTADVHSFVHSYIPSQFGVWSQWYSSLLETQ